MKKVLLITIIFLNISMVFSLSVFVDKFEVYGFIQKDGMGFSSITLKNIEKMYKEMISNLILFANIDVVWDYELATNCDSDNSFEIDNASFSTILKCAEKMGVDKIVTGSVVIDDIAEIYMLFIKIFDVRIRDFEFVLFFELDYDDVDDIIEKIWLFLLKRNEGRILKSSDGKLMILLSKNTNVKVGDRMKVYGQTFLDPNFDNLPPIFEEEEICTVEITFVRETPALGKIAEGKVVEGAFDDSKYDYTIARKEEN